MPAEEILSHPVNGTFWQLHKSSSAKSCLTLILVHGFTGSGLDFQPLLARLDQHFNWITVDLPGHGGSEDPDRPEAYSLETILHGITSVTRLADDPGNSVLLGYSMGARIALHWLNRHAGIPGILISGSPGLDLEADRIARLEADAAWIRKLSDPAVTIDEFCDEWEQQAVISSQLKLPEPLRTQVARRRRANSKHGLAHALDALGTGRLPSLWSSLTAHGGNLLIAGRQDSKFRQIAEKMFIQNPAFKLSLIENSGHAPHLENPDQTAESILTYLAGRESS